MELIPAIMIYVGVIHLVRTSLETARLLPWWDKILSRVWIASAVFFALVQIPALHFMGKAYDELILFLLLLTVYFLREHQPARLFSVALLPYIAALTLEFLFRAALPGMFDSISKYFEMAAGFSKLWFFGFGIYASVQNNKERKRRLREEEAQRQEEARKAELEHLVEERTTELTLQTEELQKALDELKAAQTQLIHAEKMASLGELTAGIAHEIQNPLNFVNNFSELSVELAQELQEELEKAEPDRELIADLVRDLAQNQQKINHHGKRAANIVTGMLQHSRTSTGAKEPTDLNLLADEYLRLSYHGLRAKDKEFNAKMVTNLDPEIGKTEVVPQDLGRVLLNLINNAFYAVTQKKKALAQSAEAAAYEPTVTVSSHRLNNKMVEIRIRDNGTGIPEDLKAKIFQPFFTTKPTGQGTGLGLSLAFDIITKGHNGTLELNSTEGEGTEFIIRLPNKT